MKRFITLMAVAILVGLVLQVGGIGFAKGPKPNYYVDESKLPFEALPGTTTDRYWGLHKGAGYRVEVPENWNGDLVLYCHGYRGDGLELTVSNPRIRYYLVASGYAWAASSYDKNGYEVKSGVKDTHALTKFFNGLVGKPNRVYITGHSMGGHITAVAIEQYPKLYDGALPMCGVMADYELFDYFQDYHLTAQYLTDMQVGVPFPDDYSTVTIPAMKDAMAYGPPFPPFPYFLNGVGEQFKTTVKYLSGGQRPFYDLAFISYADFLFTQIIDPEMVGNMDTFYHLDDILDEISADEEAINNEIYRGEPLPKYVKPNGLANVPVISGDLPIPVITLHTLGDLFVPFSMQQIYAQRAAANGKSDLLVQRAIRDFGHCYFTPDEEWEAFTDLVNWVENSVEPDGDDILDPQVVADPDFGCNFTLIDRDFGLYTAPCP
jgi:pimeloyl-ACP methyl ester carboxylesterase